MKLGRIKGRMRKHEKKRKQKHLSGSDRSFSCARSASKSRRIALLGGLAWASRQDAQRESKNCTSLHKKKDYGNTQSGPGARKYSSLAGVGSGCG